MNLCPKKRISPSLLMNEYSPEKRISPSLLLNESSPEKRISPSLLLTESSPKKISPSVFSQRFFALNKLSPVLRQWLFARKKNIPFSFTE
jgi:hypothetical protein